jgi:hypothetical protein
MEMKIKKILSIGFLAGAMVLTMPFAWQRVYAEESASETTESAEDAVVPDGVSVQGMDVSGMTYDEVNEVVDDYLAQFDDVEFTLTAGDKNITVDSSDLGLTSSTDVATKALNYGKSGNLLERYMDQKDLESGDGKDFSVSLTTDTSTVKQLLSDNESELNTEASDSTLKHENGKFTYVA